MTQVARVIVTSILLLAVAVAAPPAPEARTKVKLGQSGDILIYIVYYVARERGFFEAEGLDVETVVFGGGAKAVAAMIGGSVQFSQGFQFIPKTNERDMVLLAFVNVIDRMTIDLVMTNDALKRKSITAATPLEDKIRSLKGLRIGISSAGSTTDVAMRVMLGRRGINPDADVTLLPFGAGGPLLAAIERGAVDAIVYAPPWTQAAETKGFGKIVLSFTRGDLPEFNGYMITTGITTKKYADEHPDVVLKMTRALIRAMRYTKDNGAGSLEVARKIFPNPGVDDATFARAVEDMRAAVAGSPLFTPEHIRLNLELLSTERGKPLDIPFDRLVTNRFVNDALKELAPRK